MAEILQYLMFLFRHLSERPHTLLSSTLIRNHFYK